ncbi:hypothetical protein ABT143_33280 [Streptomyces sp. NPDC002033]|uniref:hypothetical protein n=1 Tax=unclassified Streptomyces TaxID=2593676 RepID=UPI00331E7488
MAKVKTAETPQLDRNVWEYLTFAPGRECSACKRKVQPLEPVRRAAVDRTSGAPAVSYRQTVGV